MALWDWLILFGSALGDAGHFYFRGGNHDSDTAEQFTAAGERRFREEPSGASTRAPLFLSVELPDRRCILGVVRNPVFLRAIFVIASLSLIEPGRRRDSIH